MLNCIRLLLFFKFFLYNSLLAINILFFIIQDGKTPLDLANAGTARTFTDESKFDYKYIYIYNLNITLHLIIYNILILLFQLQFFNFVISFVKLYQPVLTYWLMIKMPLLLKLLYLANKSTFQVFTITSYIQLFCQWIRILQSKGAALKRSSLR